MQLDDLARLPALAGLAPRTLLLVRTLRVWAGLRMARRCPLAMAEDRLGSLTAAAGLQRLIAVASAAWPDPIALAPPCCPVLSHDEATVAALFDRAAAGDRRGFERVCEELIDGDARHRIWTEMRAIVAALGPSTSTPLRALRGAEPWAGL